MIILPDQEVKKYKDRVVLIDADCVAYYGAAGCDALPLPSAYRRVDLRINQILDDCGTDNYECHLTGQNNFRDKVATLKRYKGDRYDKEGKRTKVQPSWLQECRKYLVDKYNATTAYYQEADDTLSTRAVVLKSLYDRVYISSIDKDLMINYCWHHNMTSGTIVEVVPPGTLELTEKGKVKGTGELFFYAQMLMGDTADCIQGLPKVTPWMKEVLGVPRLGGCGPKAAWYILGTVESAEAAEQLVWECYRDYWKKNHYYSWDGMEHFDAGIDTARKQFIEQGRLLWMRTKDGEMWKPKYIELKDKEDESSET